MPLGRPEDELLLCCARTDRSPEIATRIGTLVEASTDWEHLVRTAHAHGVAPLLFWHLDTTCPGLVPESAYSHLREYFQANSLHTLFLTGELTRLINAFGARGVPAVPLRGPALAISAYGSLALRRFLDLDIMIYHGDFAKAKEALASLGYRPRHRLTPAQELALLNSRFEYIFARDDGQSAVELHWDISEHFSSRIDPDCLWGRLQQIRLGDDLVPTLSPEDTLLMLCAHGSKHLWERLAWICDVAELIRACQNLRWEQVLAQARALGSERMVLLGLFLARDLLGAALPEEVLRRVEADQAVEKLARRICERLFREVNGEPELFTAAYFHPLHLMMKERLRDKIRFCLRVVTTQAVEDWKLLPLPDFLFPFYRMLRPVRLVSRYSLRIFKRLV